MKRWLPLLWLVACAANDDEGVPVDTPTDPMCDGAGALDQAYLISALRIAPVLDGVSEGFDLDGPDADGCGAADFVHPDGTRGVDNAFGTLLPALAVTEAAAIEPLANEAIRQGNLLVTLELSDLDDVLDDPCVDVDVGRAAGPPMLGTDGMVLWGQTLDRSGDAAYITSGEQESGSLTTDLDLTLPIEFFGIALEIELQDGALRIDQRPDGSVGGVLAGGLDIAYVIEVATLENVDPGLAAILDSLLGGAADLAPDADGACTQVSLTLTFDAVPVFFFDE